MKFTVLTLFPEMFQNYINSSIVKRAREKNLVEVEVINFRDFATNKHKSVDDYPYGGGAGMVITPEPLDNTFKSIKAKGKKVIYLTPKGKVLNQELVESLGNEEEIVLLSGHYEGIDQRIIDKYVTDEISIGDYVLSGGELGALVLIDSITRLVPGVIKEHSLDEESISSGLLEYPHYTRPSDFNGVKVPKVLISGNHKKIDEFRLLESVKLTLKRRPDLIEEGLKKNKYSEDIIKIIKQVKKDLF